ncbi:hypothetical protein ACFQ0D_36705, partial [Micromonospora zhanjiangensis]
MTTLTQASVPVGRLRTAWRAAHAPVAGVPRWAAITAYVVPLTALPASLWRIAAVTCHLPLISDAARSEDGGNLPTWLPVEVYVVLLAVPARPATVVLVMVSQWLTFLAGL